ncbi:RNA-directed DNA polymerase [Crocosphaera sp.]|uniref:RNA-directed DNA polymerase n=1 Tax=Crocosphaera sp. TaxID=2729996 RepID=UPI00261762CC|nr:RNA-directed DNA polymerase [Crocosphaera sp.]MDJ0581534.1 RNA-directed DNA polymerase [Crocosphaera sp.]
MVNFNLEDYLTDPKLIKTSIYYAIYSRLNDDPFCNFFEIRINCKNEGKINQLVEYIKNIYSLSQPYIPDESFAYAYPKGDFFIRRCIYLPFKEFAVRYHLINTISLAIENSLIETNFSSRIQRSKSGFIPLFQDYYANYKKFIEWSENLIIQYKQEKKKSCILNADITSFYDSISHDYIINSIFNLTGKMLPGKYEKIIHKILESEVEFYSLIDGLLKIETKQQGLLTGNWTEGYLANILLARLDELMVTCGFNYARYVDDIKVITNSKEECIKAVNIIQEELHRIGLNLNSAKTNIICNPKSIEDLFRKDHEISFVDHLKTEKRSEEDDNIDIGQIALKNNINKEDCVKLTNYLFDLSNFDEYDDELIIQLISKIPEMIYQYPKTIKKNTWNIVKLISFGFSNSIMIAAYKAMNEIFKSKYIMDYARTRLIHHLIKPRKKDPPYILMMTKNNDQLRQKLITIFQNFLSSKSIDLHLNCLYALWILSHQDNGNTFDEVLFRQNIDGYLPRPISHNVSRVLSSILAHKDSLNFFDYFDFNDLSDNSEKVGIDELNS